MHPSRGEEGRYLMREAENEGIRRICDEYSRKDLIWAPGGGVVAHSDSEDLRNSNVKMLKDWGQGAYLLPREDKSMSAVFLANRVDKDNRAGKEYRHPLFVKETDFTTPLEAQIKDMEIAWDKRHELQKAASKHRIYIIKPREMSIRTPEALAQLILNKCQ